MASWPTSRLHPARSILLIFPDTLLAAELRKHEVSQSSPASYVQFT